jgi:hypothetical protein
MKKSELNLTKQGFMFSCKQFAGHYKSIMKLGRCFPSSKAQANFFISIGVHFDAMNYDDVEFIENILNKYGYNGNYKYTKSKNWVKLQNMNDLYTVVKLMYK